MKYERRASSQFTFDANAAPALCDDAENRGEAQARTLAGFLGGEKRFENFGLRCTIHAGPGIGNLEPHVPAGEDTRMLTCRFFVQLNYRGFDGDGSSVGHGVPGIDDKIYDHLLDLTPVDIQQRYIRGGFEDEFDAFA